MRRVYGRRVLTLFHDPTDPASAIAVARCTRLVQEGVAIEFEGFDAVGLDVALPVDVSILGRLDALADVAAAEGLVLGRPRSTPPTGLAHVLLAHAEGTPSAAAVRTGVYAAHWAGGADIADPAVLRDVAVRAGLPAAEVDALLADRIALASRRRRMAGFRREGVGGVPVVLASRTLVPGLLEAAQLRDLAAAV